MKEMQQIKKKNFVLIVAKKFQTGVTQANNEK